MKEKEKKTNHTDLETYLESYVESDVAAKDVLKISIRQLAKLKRLNKIPFSQAVPRGRVLYKVRDLHSYLEFYRHKARFE